MGFKITVLSVLAISVALLVGCGERKQSGPAAGVSISAAQRAQNDLLKVATRLAEPAYGGVDVINEVVLPKPGSVIDVKVDKVTIAGNYVDAVKGEAAAGVVALIGEKAFVAEYGGERPDIAKTLNNPKYLKSQFVLVVPASSLGKGTHDLRFRVVASDRSGYFESPVLAKLVISD
jgi:hypothetical protein